MKESVLYKKVGTAIQCQTCAHYCRLKPGQIGLCGVRRNQQEHLMVLNYPYAIAYGIDPIEKKPLFHFMPDTRTFSFAAKGCNFRCANCQNWQISQVDSTKASNKKAPWGEKITPQEIIASAQAQDCPSISYTYTEPTIFLEYALTTMQLAKKAGLKNIWVSNGFMSSETLSLILPYLDAINIDLKSFQDDFYYKICGGRLQPVLENLKQLFKAGVWLEITTLLIPSLNTSRQELQQLAAFIKDELAEYVPWHLSAFSPEISWKMKDLPSTTSAELLAAYKIGKEAGLKFIYFGNAPALDKEDTLCPQCQKVNIKRDLYQIQRYDAKGKCFYCRANLYIQE